MVLTEPGLLPKAMSEFMVLLPPGSVVVSLAGASRGVCLEISLTLGQLALSLAGWCSRRAGHTPQGKTGLCTLRKMAPPLTTDVRLTWAAHQS